MASSSGPQYRSRDDMKRQRELEEARKAGLAPAEIDAETGQAINPHIPNYMTNAPWYLNQDQPSLAHQKDWRVKDTKILDKWYSRGARGKQNKKFQKGACENCGATTHQTKDCLERPRKLAAKWSKQDLAPDDVIEDITFESWAHKRDAYKAFRPDDYAEVVERHERLQEARQERLRKEAAAERYAEEEAQGADGAALGAADEDKLAEEEQADIHKLERRVRTAGGGSSGTVRNLRIREDTAKYLLNLDPNSAHYDPKSRSMRADPNPDKADGEKTFAGDNALRESGDFEYWRQLTQHSVLQGEAGKSQHVQAAPTQALLAHAAFKEKKARLAARGRDDVFAKYGNAAAVATQDAEHLLPVSESYVEYDRTGKVVKGHEVRVRSKYTEDIYPQNHTSVWGSYWSEGRWGYACCHSFIKNSLCVGDKAQRALAETAARTAAAEAVRRRGAIDAAVPREVAPSVGVAAADIAPRSAKGGAAPAASSADIKRSRVDLSATWGQEGDEGIVLDEAKVQAALEQLRSDAAAAREEGGGGGEGREQGGYNAAGGEGGEVTAEEMEAYRRHRTRGSDPMTAIASGQSLRGYDMV